MKLARWTPYIGTGVIVIWIVVMGAPYLGDPLFGHHHVRWNDTAAIALNFHERTTNILYPEINWSGSSPGYIEEAFQAYAYAVALLYKLFGFSEALGRGLNLLLYAGSAVLLFLLARRLYGELEGLFAAFFFAVAPLGRYYATSFQPDILTLLCSILAIYLFVYWMDEEKQLAFWGSAGVLALASMTKPISLYLGLPLAYLCFQKYGWRFLRVGRLWLYVGVVFVPTIAWYLYAHGLWLEYGNTNGMWGHGYTKFGTWDYWFSVTFHKELAKRAVYLMATIPGLVFLVLGMILRPPRRSYLAHWWAVGFCISVLMTANANLIHDYYQIPALAIVPLFMSLGAVHLWNQRELFRDTFVPSGAGAKALVLILCLTCVVVSTQASERFLRYMDPRQERERAFTERLTELTEPGSLVVVGTAFSRGPDPAGPHCCRRREPDGRYLGNAPVVLYQSHRRGWTLHLEDWSVETIEYLRAKGAGYFGSWYSGVFADKADFLSELGDRFTVIEKTDQWVIYRL